MLLVVEQVLALIAAGLGLVDLVLSRVAAGLAVVEVCLSVGEVDGAGEVRWVGGRSFVAKLGLVSLERCLVDVDECLFAVGDALVEIGQGLLLLELRGPSRDRGAAWSCVIW